MIRLDALTGRRSGVNRAPKLDERCENDLAHFSSHGPDVRGCVGRVLRVHGIAQRAFDFLRFLVDEHFEVACVVLSPDHGVSLFQCRFIP